LDSLLEFKAALRELITRPDAGDAGRLIVPFYDGAVDDLVNDSWCGIAWEITAGRRQGAPPPGLADCWFDVEEIVRELAAIHNLENPSHPVDTDDVIDLLRAILLGPTR
jgi:hypothetical protein